MIHIITDSAADFEKNEIEALNIHVVPISILIGKDEFKEGVNLTKNEFYEKLILSEEFPKTSQPTTADFTDILEEFKNQGDEVVGIFLSSKLSGTFQGAVIAKNMCEYENCYLVDSLTVASGEKLLVEIAVKLREEGKTAVEIFEALEKIKSKIKLYACLDTLEYLKRGGRISASSAVIGATMHVKPVICVENGVVENRSKVIGKRKGMGYLSSILKEQSYDDSYPVYILYSHHKANALLLKEYLLKENIDVPEENLVNIGAAIGAHVGPSAFGIAYISKS